MDASEIPDHTNAFRVAKLLGIDGRDLAEAPTTKTIFAQGDSVVRNSLTNIDCVFLVCHAHSKMGTVGFQSNKTCRFHSSFS